MVETDKPKNMEDSGDKSQETSSSETSPDIPKDKSMLEQAKEQADRLEKLNSEMKENLDRQERLAADNMLGGRSNAGSIGIQKPIEKTDEEIAEEFRAGKLGNPFKSEEKW